MSIGNPIIKKLETDVISLVTSDILFGDDPTLEPV